MMMIIIIITSILVLISNSGTDNSSGNNRRSLSWAQLSAIRGKSSGSVEACKENKLGSFQKSCNYHLKYHIKSHKAISGLGFSVLPLAMGDPC